jgi:uncharacterized protein
MLFVVVGLDKPEGGAAIRRRVRKEHLEFVVEHQDTFHYGGPLMAENGQTVGSLMIFDVADQAVLDRLLQDEPYCREGLFDPLIIRPSRQVVPETAPGRLIEELSRERLALQQSGSH